MVAHTLAHPWRAWLARVAARAYAREWQRIEARQRRITAGLSPAAARYMVTGEW